MSVMEMWYRFVDIILPFDWSGHIFMKNALLAILLSTPVFGLLGTMIVNNRMAFFSDALGHGAFTGIAIGGLFGFMRPVWTAAVFSVIFALVITAVKYGSKGSTDTIIGVFSSFSIAAGLVIMSGGGSIPAVFLVGDLLSITPSEIAMLAVVSVAVYMAWFFILNRIFLISINQSLARSRGINTLANEVFFTAIIAVIVTISLQWVGILIINSMLVLPAAAARNVTGSVRSYHAFSIVTAVVSGLGGLVLSYYRNTATGATIVLVLAFVYFITLILKNRFLK